MLLAKPSLSLSLSLYLYLSLSLYSSVSSVVECRPRRVKIATCIIFEDKGKNRKWFLETSLDPLSGTLRFLHYFFFIILFIFSLNDVFFMCFLMSPFVIFFRILCFLLWLLHKSVDHHGLCLFFIQRLLFWSILRNTQFNFLQVMSFSCVIWWTHLLFSLIFLFLSLVIA